MVTIMEIIAYYWLTYYTLSAFIAVPLFMQNVITREEQLTGWGLTPNPYEEYVILLIFWPLFFLKDLYIFCAPSNLFYE